MPSTTLRSILVVAALVCVLALAGAEPPGVTGSRRGPSPPAVEGPGLSYDEPDAAFELYRLKRLGASPGRDPVAAYQTALAHMDGMPRHSMAIDPENPDVLYIGTGEGYFREIVRGTWLPLRGAAIYKSSDGGATWSKLPATDTAAFHWVNDLVISPRDPNRIYAATRTGVHLSENGGGSWKLFLDPGVNGGCLDLALRTDLAVDWLFASCGTFEQATVYRRRMTRLGEWEAVLSEPGMGRTTLAVAPSDQRVVYALSASNDAGPAGHFEQALLAVYRSTAGGNPDRLYLGTDLGVFTTINGGRTWAVENNGFANVVTEWLTLGTDGDGEPWLFAFTHGRGAFKVRLNPLPAPPRESAGRRSP